MVHLRLNTREANPNEHVNFITALPMRSASDSEDARQYLRALAAQVKPVMKRHGFQVNSLEEYEFNKVFSGRNWNAGETVELVLRGPGGQFLPTSWLINTFCHELAHITHMNHSPSFHALWAQLREEVRELQREGYYGDGFWSSGTRLADYARIGGQGLDPTEVPEYLCGGAHSRARPARQRRRHKEAGPSNSTGAQTAKRRKAGGRVTAKDTFSEGGRSLDEDITDLQKKKSGAGFRKQAGSKRARDERLAAIEKRLRALQGETEEKPANPIEGTLEEEEDDSDIEIILETDAERRRVMLDACGTDDSGALRSSGVHYSNDFIMPKKHASSASAQASERRQEGGSNGEKDVIEFDSDGEISKGKAPSRKFPPRERTSNTGTPTSGTIVDKWATTSKSGPSLKLGALAKDEIAFRKKESIGLAGTGSGRTVGRASAPSTSNAKSDDRGIGGWDCLVCTLHNEPGHLACSACGTSRGQAQWTGNSI